MGRQGKEEESKKELQKVIEKEYESYSINTATTFLRLFIYLLFCVEGRTVDEMQKSDEGLKRKTRRTSFFFVLLLLVSFFSGHHSCQNI